MNLNVKGSDRFVLAGVIDPNANATDDYLSGAVDLGNFESIVAVVLAGTFGTDATIDAKLVQATTSDGEYKDVEGKAITQLTDADDDGGKQAIINCRGDELDVANGYRFVKLSLTVGNETEPDPEEPSGCAGVIFGLDARNQTAADVSSVDEVVA